MPVFGIVRDFLGKATITVGSGSRSLTPNEYARPRIVFTGTLTANETYTLPANNQTYRVENQATGAFLLYLKRGTAGVAQVVPVNEPVEVLT